MPKNTAMGFYIAVATFFVGFGLVWHIMWLALVAFIVGVICVLIRSFDYEIDYIVPIHEIVRVEGLRKHTN